MGLNRVLWFSGPYQLDVRTEAPAQPEADEVLVQTAVSAISPGTEMLLYRGQWPENVPVDETISSLSDSFQYPLKYGYACVGKVVEVGKNVSTEWHGRWVFAFQPHESYFTSKPEHLQALPGEMAPETAVFLPNMETAVSFVMDATPLIGEQVAIFGQGIVGLLTTALLAQFPLAALVAVDGFARRREWSQKLGATAVFNPHQPDILPQVRKALQKGRPYDGADLALELSGNPAALELAIQVMGFDGRILVGSWYGQKRAELNLGDRFHRRQLRLISSQVSHVNPRWHGRFSKRRRLQIAWRLLTQHDPIPFITHRIPITQAREAYRILDEQPETAVQILLTYKD